MTFALARAAGFLLSCLCVPFVTAQAQQQPITFAMIGDLAYAPAREPLLDNVLADINKTPLAFVVHVGDLSSPRYSCTDEIRAKRLAQFRAMAHPLIYTPGDNEWTDCHDIDGLPALDPLERLSNLRGMFFEGDKSLGQQTIPLTRQSAGDNPAFAKFRENARWQLGGVTFLTMHTVGSNNGLGRNAAGDAEVAERTYADIAWLQQGFALAKSSNSRAIMILTQANMFPEFPPFPGNPAVQPSGFTDLRAALKKEVLAFDKPVVLVNGDSHYFRIDKPFARRNQGSTEPLIENFTRVETFGDPVHHWVHVTIEPDDPNVFTFRQRIVTANIEKKH